MSIEQFFTWVVAGGGSIALFSFISQRIKKFVDLPGDTKWWIQIVGSSVIGMTVLAIQMYVPPEFIDKLAPFFVVVAGIVINQLAHRVDPSTR